MAEKKYIEREAAYPLAKKICDAIDKVPRCILGQDILDFIDDIPAADVRPVVRGQNIYDTVKGHCEFKCSVCGVELSSVYGGRNDVGLDGGYFNFCPNCGAMMEES